MQHLLRLFGVAICAAVIATAAASARAGPDASIVSVQAQLGIKGGQGTGFLVSSSGEVVTAYHVIFRAERIDLFWHGTQFKNVSIVRIRPDVDLAVLRIEDALPTGMQPLRLTEHAGSWSAGQSIQVVGHPRGLPLQRYDGTITQEGFLLSKQLRNNQGRPLFRQDEIRLVPADVTIYSGLSGSPILLNNEVIGVLSGSLDVGRGISWGIPVDYLRNMQEIGRRAGEMGQWPDFVMTADWSNVRATYRLNAGVQEMLDQYFDSVNQFALSDEDLLSKLHKGRGLLTVAIQLFTPPSGTPDAADWWPGELGEKFVMDQLAPALTQVQEAFFRNGNSESKIRYALGRLLSQKKEQYAGLPRTVTNLRAMEDADDAEIRIFERYKGLDEEALQTALKPTELLKNLRPVGELPSQEREKARLRPALLENWRLAVRMLEDQTQFKAVDERNARLQRYVDIGEMFEQVFFHELDLANDALQYRSSLGYTITMPRGWVPASQELLQLNLFRGIHKDERMDFFFIKTGFIGDGRSSFDIVDTTLPGVLESNTPITDEELTHLRTVLLNKALRIHPDFRELSLQRASFGSWNGVLARGVYGPEPKSSHFQQLFIFLPNRAFSIECWMSPDGDMNECEAIVNSVRFE